MDTMKSRVEEALKRKGLSLRKVANTINVDPSAITKALNKESTTYPHLEAIAQQLDVSADWIRNGGTPPWKARASENFDDDYGSLQQELEILRKHYAILAERYLDLVDLCEKNKLKISKRAIEETKKVLDSL